MSTGTVTTTADNISPKTPTALRVIFKKPAGNENSLALSDINEKDYVTREMLEGFLPGVGNIIFTIPPNDDSFYVYAYDGTLGDNPTAFLQLRISSPSLGWSTVGQGSLLDDGTIYFTGDFSTSTGDAYRAMIKP